MENSNKRKVEMEEDIEDYFQMNPEEVAEMEQRLSAIQLEDEDCSIDEEDFEYYLRYLLQNGDFPKAMSVLCTAQRFYPDSPYLKYAQAMICMEKGWTDKAKEILNSLIEENTDEMVMEDLLYPLLQIYVNEGDFAKAEEILNNGNLPLDPTTFHCRMSIYATLDKEEEEYAFLKQCVLDFFQNEDLDLDSVFFQDIFMLYASVALLREPADKAGILPLLEQGLGDGYLDNSFYWTVKGMLFRSNEDFEKAMECLEYALALDEDNPYALAEKYKCLSCLNQMEDALDFLEKLNRCVLQNETGNIVYLRPTEEKIALLQLAKAYEVAERGEEAIQTCHLLLEKYPEEPEVRLHLGDLYMNMHAYQQVIDQMLLFLEYPLDMKDEFLRNQAIHANSLLTLAYDELEDRDRSLEYSRKVVRLCAMKAGSLEEYISFLFDHVLLLSGTGCSDEAMEFVEDLWENNRIRQSSYLIFKAYVHLYSGMKKEATALLEQALAMDPEKQLLAQLFLEKLNLQDIPTAPSE